MKAVIRRIRILEEGHAAQRNAQGLTPVDVLRQRICRRQAEETGRPYEELLRESVMKHQAFWENYDGERTIAGILRSRFQRRPLAQPTQLGKGIAADSASR
jgi:hypothetical protein